MVATIETRMASGEILHIEMDDASRAAFEYPWSGNVRLTLRYGQGATAELWGIDLAPVASLAAGIEFCRGKVAERFDLGGGEVVIVNAQDPKNARWAAWVGPWHMAHCFFYPPLARSTDIVELFTRVQWVDTPEGMTVDPGPKYDLATDICLTPVTGVGLLRIESKRTSQAAVPRWQGAMLPAGEAWRVPNRAGATADSLLYVTDTALSLLVPGDVADRRTALPTARPGAGTAQRALDFLGTLQRVDLVA